MARPLPFSKPVISTESREGGMALVARIQSPTFLSFLYSTRKDWIGKPPFPRGIQVTYTDVSEAMEIVGLSGASGAGETIHEGGRKQEGTGLGDNRSMAPGLGLFLIGRLLPAALHPGGCTRSS